MTEKIESFHVCEDCGSKLEYEQDERGNWKYKECKYCKENEHKK